MKAKWIIIILVVITYFGSWINFGARKAMLQETNSIVNQEFFQAYEDSNIYIINYNKIGFSKKVLPDRVGRYELRNINSIDDIGKDGQGRCVLVFDTSLYNPFLISFTTGVWSVGSDTYDSYIRYFVWMFFDWVRSPIVFTGTNINFEKGLPFILENLALPIILLVLVSLLYFSFKKKFKNNNPV